MCCSCHWFFTNFIICLNIFISWITLKFWSHFCHLGFSLSFLPCISCKPSFTFFLLPFHSSKIADLWRLNYCKIIYINIYRYKQDLKIWYTLPETWYAYSMGDQVFQFLSSFKACFKLRGISIYLSVWNKIWNLIRTERSGPPSVIPWLFLRSIQVKEEVCYITSSIQISKKATT